MNSGAIETVLWIILINIILLYMARVSHRVFLMQIPFIIWNKGDEAKKVDTVAALHHMISQMDSGCRQQALLSCFVTSFHLEEGRVLFWKWLVETYLHELNQWINFFIRSFFFLWCLNSMIVWSAVGAFRLTRRTIRSAWFLAPILNAPINTVGRSLNLMWAYPLAMQRALLFNVD